MYQSYQLTFAALQLGPCVNELINLTCNMIGNMLNDLAEAIRRWTEKNTILLDDCA